MTAEEVYGELHSNGSTVGRTTVYRHLEKLYAEGAIRKFLTGDNSGACFQYVDNPEACHNHYHLRCNSCGRLIHTDCDFLNELAEHIKDSTAHSNIGSSANATQATINSDIDTALSNKANKTAALGTTITLIDKGETNEGCIVFNTIS